MKVKMIVGLLIVSLVAFASNEKTIKCPTCGGFGKEEVDCDACNGTGTVQRETTRKERSGFYGSGYNTRTVMKDFPCGKCNRLGSNRGKMKVKCSTCDGMKKIPNPDYVEPDRSSDNGVRVINWTEEEWAKVKKLVDINKTIKLSKSNIQINVR